MLRILHIETASTQCSVSVSENDKVIALQEINAGYTHAENLHLFVKAALDACSLKTSDLHAIAVSRGPGSYTGLRIGMSAAKGLAFALNIPLIALDTLQIMAIQARERCPDAAYYCPMLDARRMEVYTALYDKHIQALRATEALIVNPESLENYRAFEAVCFFGDGMNKCKSLLSELKNPLFAEGIFPSAAFMPGLALEKYQKGLFEDKAYCEPLYLKDILIKSKKGI
ncbi:MAG TPA: tRNA (adenosine(37)-N6)-threonylcarbamoyltransferase complex dimerization subunit type 1 TsaB [Bacteroidia bacterium]|nr:tRNA (adenosine(37)-N6)-threonylcarbamoyltransferase complex dimerization subunit type 1 TsaB [Bacteroidia bacterium]